MAQTLSVIAGALDQQRLQSIAADRNRPGKHLERPRALLDSIDPRPVQQIADEAGIRRPPVWRWQQRFAEGGVDGLLHDKTRPPRTPPMPPDVAARVVTPTCGSPPHQGDTLDRARHGEGRGHLAAPGAAHLASTPA